MSKEDGAMKYLFVLAVAVAGCGTKPNPNSCADDHCNDPSKPFCDEDGAIGGKPDTCIAVECMPGTFETCRDDHALMCTATGNNYETTQCEYGCSDAAQGCNDCNTSACEKHIIPKYLPNICNQLAEGDALTISAPLEIDTSNPVNCHSVVAQSSGPEICVFRRKAITLEANQTVTVFGTRAIAFVVDRDLIIDGIMDASGRRFGPVLDMHVRNGPGGGFFKSGSGGYPEGGGGAGFRTNGGSGGTTTADGGAANGGAASTNPSQLAYLVGGTRPQSPDMFERTGGGGGAVTLISCRGSVRIAGLIDVVGGGGDGGYGGGSGGNVVVQGMTVDVTGQFYANGGAGGGGLPGQDGTRSTTMPAMGGTNNGSASFGIGGHGGKINLDPGPGSKVSDPSGYPGGGGGSVGFFQTYTPEGTNAMIAPLAASPAFGVNLSVPTN